MENRAFTDESIGAANATQCTLGGEGVIPTPLTFTLLGGVLPNFPFWSNLLVWNDDWAEQ